ncbi:MAG: DOMON-like domain-containing protein [Nostoc sp.]|uniref:DOMON-like domain-containing protein n=1 Tax=unclassified Nostoc TaxID=2593658 RepID=UPI0025F657C0|nr:DOMON-like domain-containing protein [Nostoc sp. NMS9]MBN3942559.1 DOMON-like domain-containing protein [Nostoc sp. NMS9]
MNKQTFSLQPFSSTESFPDFKIAGNIARNANLLTISYTLGGDFKEIAIVPPSNAPSRKHELWEDTCFEFFLGIKDSARYWEFNLSPAGHWNVYRFDGYRQGMQEETAFEKLPFNVQSQADGLALVLDVDLSKIVSANQALEIGITTVIKHKNGDVTYWALTHRGAEADFHLRDSFIIEL